MSSVDPRVRELLVCPLCRGPLVDVADGLRCEAEGLTFPVVDGVPWLVRERARRDEGAASDPR